MLSKIMPKIFKILFIVLTLGSVASITIAEENPSQDVINPPKIEGDINILGVKIGDTLDEAKKNAVNDPDSKQIIKDIRGNINPINNARFVTQAGIFYSVPVKVTQEAKEAENSQTSSGSQSSSTTSSSSPSDMANKMATDIIMRGRGPGVNVEKVKPPFDTISFLLTDLNSGNRVYAIKREFNPNNNKDKQNILIDNCVKQIIEKFGKPPILKEMILSDKTVYMQWYFDEKGKLVTNKAEYEKYQNCMGGVCDKCPGTTISIRVQSLNGFVSFMEQNIIAHGFATAANNKTQALVKSAQESDLKKRQEDGTKSKMSL